MSCPECGAEVTMMSMDIAPPIETTSCTRCDWSSSYQMPMDEWLKQFGHHPEDD